MKGFGRLSMRSPWKKLAIGSVVITAAFLVFSFSAWGGDNASLTVQMGPPVQYESEDGKRFTARYGSLSDGSLHFVKVTLPDGKEYTLPQIISGSGARYTDERELVWWTHQGAVRVDVRNDDGEWETKYSDLKEIREGKSGASFTGSNVSR